MSSANETFEIGRKLVELCNQGRNLEAIEQLYAPTIVSIETHGSPEMPARMQGIDAIRQKNQWWFQNHTIHSGQVQGPWPHGDRFIVTMKYEITPKAGPMAGQRMTVEEAGLYTVRDGKIVQEEFFYHM
ncbi:MAG TPA: nuclear transport factor 2 family protein [Tepidisphaeraceae bacterium]|nr:nuclear transport factor 2 family protein [Tepidisphaeraceae bacterium]